MFLLGNVWCAMPLEKVCVRKHMCIALSHSKCHAFLFAHLLNVFIVSLTGKREYNYTPGRKNDYRNAKRER